MSRSLGFDFALLGLKARESRVEMIRRAARQTAELIRDAAQGEQEHLSMLADIATSTYRLLDPRKRKKMLERVQLSIFSEECLSLQQDSRTALLPIQKQRVVAELVEADSTNQNANNQSSQDIDCVVNGVTCQTHVA